MYCKNCGTKLLEGSSFCTKCGTPCNRVNPLGNTFQQFNSTQQGNSFPIAPNNKKKDNVFFLVTAIIGIALIALPIVMGLNSSKKHADLSTSSNYNPVSGYEEVTFQKFTFQIPKESTTQIEGDSLYIYNLRDAGSFAILGVEKGDFNQFKKSKTYVKNYMQNSGYDVGDINIATYNGVEFFVAPIKQNNYNLILAYAKLAEDFVAMVVVANYSYQLDYSLLNAMAPIISSGRKIGSNSGTVGV